MVRKTDLLGVDYYPSSRDELLCDIMNVVDYLQLGHVFKPFMNTIHFEDNGYFVVIRPNALASFRQDLYKRVEYCHTPEEKPVIKEEPVSQQTVSWLSQACNNMDKITASQAVAMTAEMMLIKRQNEMRKTTPKVTRRRRYDEDELFEAETVEYHSEISDDFISDVEDFRLGGGIDETWED